ncbi:MAG: hypothetical protein ACOYKZ_01775 [Chlamydiia bacterium]
MVSPSRPPSTPERPLYNLQLANKKDEPVETQARLSPSWYENVVNMAELNSRDEDIAATALEWLCGVPGWDLTDAAAQASLMQKLQARRREGERRVQFLARDPETGEAGKVGKSEKKFSDPKLEEKKVNGVTTVLFTPKATPTDGLVLGLKEREMGSKTPYLDAIAVVSQESSALARNELGILLPDQLMNFALNAAQLQLRAAQSFSRDRNQGGVIDRVQTMVTSAAPANAVLKERAERIERAYRNAGQDFSDHIDQIAPQLAKCLLGAGGFGQAVEEAVDQDLSLQGRAHPAKPDQDNLWGRIAIAATTKRRGTLGSEEVKQRALPPLPHEAPAAPTRVAPSRLQESSSVGTSSAPMAGATELEKTFALRRGRSALTDDLSSLVGDAETKIAAAGIRRDLLEEITKQRGPNPTPESDAELLTHLSNRDQDELVTVASRSRDPKAAQRLEVTVALLNKLAKGLSTRTETARKEGHASDWVVTSFNQLLKREGKNALGDFGVGSAQQALFQDLQRSFNSHPKEAASALITRIKKTYDDEYAQLKETTSTLREQFYAIPEAQRGASPLAEALNTNDQLMDALSTQCQFLLNLSKNDKYAGAQ